MSQTDDADPCRWVCAPTPSSSVSLRTNLLVLRANPNPRSQVTHHCRHWWPRASPVPVEASLYWKQWKTATAPSSAEFLNSNRKRGVIYVQTISKQKRSHKFHSPRQSIQHRRGLPAQPAQHNATTSPQHSPNAWRLELAPMTFKCDIRHPAIEQTCGMASQACCTKRSKRLAVCVGADGSASTQPG